MALGSTKEDATSHECTDNAVATESPVFPYFLKTSNEKTGELIGRLAAFLIASRLPPPSFAEKRRASSPSTSRSPGALRPTGRVASGTRLQQHRARVLEAGQARLSRSPLPVSKGEADGGTDGGLQGVLRTGACGCFPEADGIPQTRSPLMGT